jgi:hypothetical protein
VTVLLQQSWQSHREVVTQSLRPQPFARRVAGLPISATLIVGIAGSHCGFRQSLRRSSAGLARILGEG